MTPWAGRRSLSSQVGANRTRLGCVHSDKSWAGIGLLLSQAEEEKLHPFLPLERKRRMSSVLCPWYRSAPQFSGRGAGRQQLQGQEDIDANIVPTTAISTLSPHPYTSPSLQPCNCPQDTAQRSEHPVLGAPSSLQQSGRRLGGCQRRGRKRSSVSAQTPPWPAPLSPGPCRVPPSPARLSELILVKMSP